MSGAAVFDSFGHVCGIVSSAMPPVRAEDEYLSYASLLWPALGIPVNMNWPSRYPNGEHYPVYEMAHAGFISTKGLEKVRILGKTLEGSHIQCEFEPPDVE
jgi:hypothetical protein